MNNLFVMHTQYNLILACGLALEEFKEDTNDLILFQDFAITVTMKETLEKVFRRVVYFPGSFPKENNKYRHKLKNYPQIIRIIQRFITVEYSKTFLVDDMNIPEMYIMKEVYKRYKKVQFIWLEDGGTTYFKNHTKSGGMSSNPISIVLRCIIFKYLFGLGPFYDLSMFIGGHYLLKIAYVTYPDYVHKEYKDKILVEITTKTFLEGLHALYTVSDITLPDHAVIIILDLISVYKNKNRVNQMIGNVLQQYVEDGYRIYYKYHPREDATLTILDKYEELNRNVAIESIYSNIKGKDIVVIGIQSTGLQTANKLGYKTISLIKCINPKEKAISKFYSNIGVECIKVK